MTIPRPRGLLLAGLIGAALAARTPARADDAGLTLADLEGYREALASRPRPSASPVRFRDLWDRPAAYLGTPVRVEGRVARTFRQPPIGEFPPLAEAWIVSEAREPTCLVFPAPEGSPTPAVGTRVRFAGTFLKRLKYRGGDAARLAPLIVGPDAPSVVGAGPSSWGGESWSAVDWALGLGAAVVAGLVLARRHLSRPDLVPDPPGPPPAFVDGEPDRDPGGIGP